MMQAVFFVGPESASLCQKILGMEGINEIERLEGVFTEVEVALGSQEKDFLNIKFLYSEKTANIKIVPEKAREERLRFNETVVVVDNSKEFLSVFPFIEEATDRNYFFVKNSWQGPAWLLLASTPEKVLSILFPE
jgi:hypothetical protein